MLSSFAVQVQNTITANRLLDRDDSVLVGVSGGADSVSLVLVLNELGYRIAVAHLNHALRGGAANDDEEFTKQLSARLGVPFFSRTVPVKDEGGNLEAAGRMARKAFFSEIAEASGFTRIALAHTRDDRIETFLMNLLRGAGVEGLLAMGPISGNLVRPLLEIRRVEVEEYLRSRNQSWRTDETNLDMRFTRNRVRHDLLPKLAAEFNIRLADTLERTIGILSDEDVWMRNLTEGWLAENGLKGVDSLSLDLSLASREALQKVPRALVRRVIRSALKRAGSTLHDLSFDHVEAVRTLLEAGKSGKYIEIPGGLVVARSFDRLIFHARITPITDYEYELKIPGRIHIPEVGRTFVANIVEREDADAGCDRVFVDGACLGPYVRIRNWKPGDYYRPAGLPAGKLKKLFQRARIPRGQRGSWPVLVADSTIVWVASFPVSRECVPGGHSQKIVAFEASAS